jgi:DNA polymerase-1
VRYFTVNTDHKWLNLPDDTLGIYNYWDCFNTAKGMEEQTKEQKDNNQYTHYRETFWPLVPAVMTMAKRGMLLDHDALHEVRREAEREIEECRDSILPFTTNKDINLNSYPQKGALLYDELGFKCGKKTATGGRSTDQEALVWILSHLRKKDEQFIPVIHALFHRSRWQTIASRYLHPHIYPDGRVRPTVKMGKAETLRLAYANPPLQQMPKEIRRVYKAERGFRYVALDYSQLEARILAVLCGDSLSLEAFRQGKDIHRENALDLFGYLEDYALGVGERDYAKSFLYKLSYGGSSATADNKQYCPCPKCIDKVPAVLDLKQSAKKDMETRWLRKHRAVATWRNRLVEEVKKKGYYTTPFGYKRFFFPPARSILPEIYNFPMQATAAGLMNRSTILAHKARLPLVLQYHDELMMECPESTALKSARKLKEIMEFRVPELEDTIFPVDVAIGENWGEMKEVEV